ncbi:MULTISPECIES: CoA-binding protein [unclassified Clostridium]|uniref:CoA-binding protein n=1 Tax=unclassified Clostridium TaxID=2614128 RepID=UPI00189A3172|nr:MULTISPECIES: CoA-binding protein [unclassified Clostridium]MCR1950347.1 CoA-binding protein [Clostridium sp. DSM 100503]
MNIEELMKLKNWVVIGDVSNETKYANKILNKFKLKGYKVSGVHPKGGEDIYTNLKEVPYNIEAIDLCINAKYGIEFLKEARELGIKNVLIQPGAESDEILKYCNENSINTIENCALIQLNHI